MICNGRLLDLSAPCVMGILNVTPDSFYDGGKYTQVDAALRQAEQMLEQGAILLDVGGASSRPGASALSAEAEQQRVVPVITEVAKRWPEAIISIDTWHAQVAKAALDAGASIVNDISAGRFDSDLWPVVKNAGAPYVLMHMQGAPETMQQQPQYADVLTDVIDFFVAHINRLHQIGVYDIILDPGFGFGKTVEHNYTLLKNMGAFRAIFDLPVLAGISRKSMICKPLGVSPANALNGTTALHMIALQQGASILRAHDVREALEVIKLWQLVR